MTETVTYTLCRLCHFLQHEYDINRQVVEHFKESDYVLILLILLHLDDFTDVEIILCYINQCHCTDMADYISLCSPCLRLQCLCFATMVF